MKDEQLMTRTHLALKLDVSPRHIHNLEKKGLPVVWVGAIPRYNYRQVIKWLNAYYKALPNKPAEGGEEHE